jgi:4-hydroxy-tetrahydrodipicolinate synthase
MSTKADRIGLSCALSTPFTADGHIDLPRIVAHGRWVLENGGDGLAVFGTTGEGASIGLRERHYVLGAFAAAGFDMRKKIIAGVTASTIEDAVEQARAGYAAGCRGLLMTPSFYFPNTSEEGVFRWFAAVFEALGGELRDVLLYHIPSMTRSVMTPDLMGRLREKFPGAILGIKDSSGDWNSSKGFLDRHKDLQILVGDERQLARAVQNGGSGTICGLANLRPDVLRPAAWDGKDDPKIGALVAAIIADPFMSAVKALIAHRTGDKAWLRMRPPLDALDDAKARALVERFEAAAAAKAA